VSIPHRSVMIALLSLCLAAPGQLAAQSHQDSGPGMNQTDSEVPGLHDFDFLVGQWQAHHRKLKQRIANNHEWIEFEGTLLNQPLMGSYSNVDVRGRVVRVEPARNTLMHCPIVMLNYGDPL